MPRRICSSVSAAVIGAAFLMSSFAMASDPDIDKAVAVLPADCQGEVRDALVSAGKNGPELIAAIGSIKPEQRRALAFLLAHMPVRDLTTLDRNFLIENVSMAFEARKDSAWGASLPDEIFQNYVLPFANLNEKRENWRRDFQARFSAEVKECKSSSDAALMLNRRIFDILKVHYHATKRPKPDQSPGESIEAGYASCTGLSILLVDACRAVGVPARVVAIPGWTVPRGDKSGNHRGNHTWVEIWDGQWHVLGASEVTPLDRTWFMGSAAEADPERVEHCIYAASFEKTSTVFPLIWDPAIDYVHADDVTRFYSSRKAVEVRILDRRQGEPARANLTLRLHGKIVASIPVDGQTTLTLAGGCDYDATLVAAGAALPVAGKFSISETQKEPVTLYLKD